MSRNEVGGEWGRREHERGVRINEVLETDSGGRVRDGHVNIKITCDYN